MKKRFLILVPLCISMTLVGCGNEEPSQIIENSQEISQSTTPTLDFNIDVNNIAKEESNILDGIVKEELEIEEFIEQASTSSAAFWINSYEIPFSSKILSPLSLAHIYPGVASSNSET